MSSQASFCQTIAKSVLFQTLSACLISITCCLARKKGGGTKFKASGSTVNSFSGETAVWRTWHDVWLGRAITLWEERVRKYKGVQADLRKGFIFHLWTSAEALSRALSARTFIPAASITRAGYTLVLTIKKIGQLICKVATFNMQNRLVWAVHTGWFSRLVRYGWLCQKWLPTWLPCKEEWKEKSEWERSVETARLFIRSGFQQLAHPPSATSRLVVPALSLTPCVSIIFTCMSSFQPLEKQAAWRWSCCLPPTSERKAGRGESGNECCIARTRF